MAPLQPEPSGSALARGEWRVKARCRTVAEEVFYPPERETRRARRERETVARQICWTCPVQVPCRRFAVATQEPHGVWGGTTPLDRRRLAGEARPRDS
ncbi:WhiB family transcriptional regulator [Mycobacterium yunnanensis]|uniref:Transcriptional regulator WhiB n=1 Tax=Mycobacterium yunnanensis TaxID=368477 RepID=A0A9X2Z6B8_9MYCO|nr:WhiB family transcriptional regulator [Mycobacterium yunnanensis]